MAATIDTIHPSSKPSAKLAAGPTLRSAMRELASGVSIVTTGLPPERNGFTATSVVSLSVEPPRILACFGRSTTALATIERCRIFAVSILARQHLRLAERFAGRTGEHGEARFSGACWHTLETGASVLCDALAAVDCVLEDLIPRDSHVIAIGRVVAVRVPGHGHALVYWRGNFDQLGATGGEPDFAQWAPIL